jgi:peptidyl-tRNA hydrolase
MLLRFKGAGQPEWLIAFLGNPGQKYDKTRHNAGFMAADILADEKGIKLKALKFKALTEKCTLGGAGAFLIKPQTFMNLSGESIQPAAAFYKIDPQHVIVVCDDTALPLGKIRIKRQGSSGGHNGLKSIISSLGTDEFPRVKIGVGSPAQTDPDYIDWVIGRMSDSDYKTLYKAAGEAVKAIEAIIELGVDAAMNKYN